MSQYSERPLVDILHSSSRNTESLGNIYFVLEALGNTVSHNPGTLVYHPLSLE